MIELRELTSADEAAFLAGFSAWPAEDASWHSFIWKPGTSMTYSEMIERLRKDRLGIDLEAGRVPHTMLYGFVNGEIVGRVSVRHQLNDFLRKRGGHLGYAVAPKFRRKGYAQEMVRQALEYCRSLGLEKILITCGDENTASYRLIENLGAQLENRTWDETDQEMIRRYWLEL